MKLIDDFLDRITMYRLLLYYLLALLGVAAVLGGLGYMPYSPQAVIGSAAYLMAACWITNKVFAYILDIPTNYESSLITALILSLIITPLSSPQNFVFLSAAAGLAIASKYLLVIRRQHIFNPAAIAVALTALGAGQSASWWVGNAQLLPVVLIGGMLLARKIRRGQMIVIFLVTSLIASVILTLMHHGNVIDTTRNLALHSSAFFLAFVMLTEPLTSPSVVSRQRWYGGLAGLLFPPQVHLLGLFSTPELVLVVSNIFAYIIGPRVKLLPQLNQKLTWGPSTKDFIFVTDQPFKYKPGQYMEWTLPHTKTDNRGNRRYFTLASSPTEPNLRLGIKFYAKGSSFKQAMLSMDRNTQIAAGQLGGDFTLPADPARKLAFIAGGIGITPFRSMIKYLVDSDEKRSVTLLYSEKNPADFAYYDVFKEAKSKLGIKTVYTITDKNVGRYDGVRNGQITHEMIKAEVPDYLERMFYVSGPHRMVTSLQHELRGLGVQEHNIKIDFFPGYA